MFSRIFLTIILFCSILPAFGAEEQQNELVSFTHIINKGGAVMIPLYIISFVVVCLVFYYIFTLKIEIIAPKSFFLKVDNALQDNDLKLLKSICTDEKSISSNIIENAVDTAEKTTNISMIKEALEDEGSRQASLLWQKIQYLYDIAVIAPMIGLFGTVLGMIKTFIGFQEESAIPQQTQITSGISMALITTAAGLALGILSMVLYSYFRGRTTRLITELEYRCNRVLAAFYKNNK